MSDKSISELTAEIKDLQSRLDFLMSAVDNLPNPIFMKDEDAKFFFFNKAYSKFFNMKRRDYIGKTVLDLDYLDPKERKKFQKEDLALIEKSEILEYDTVFPDEKGNERTSFYWSSGFQDSSSGRKGLVGEIVDISRERNLQQSLDKSLEELKSVNDRLRIMAETDSGSGLYNRSVLWTKGKDLIKQSIKMGHNVCMAMLDLDNFKQINDNFGHLMGDEIIESFARILRSESRKTDLAVRYGGDEFVLVLFGADLEKSKTVAERIRKRCEDELLLPDTSSATASVGVTEVNKSEDLEANLKKLDDLLYEAKEKGRNKVVSA